jgi:hypothetical protein
MYSYSLIGIDRDSVDSIAYRYGAASPGVEPWGGGKIFHTGSDRPLGIPSLLYNGHCVPFPGFKRSRLVVDHSPPSSVGVKKKSKLHLYSPSWLPWPVTG